MTGHLTTVELASLLDTAGDLLAVPSTADRPDELRRALDVVVDFVGPGFVVERFESNGKPSALIYRAAPGASVRDPAPDPGAPTNPAPDPGAVQPDPAAQPNPGGATPSEPGGGSAGAGAARPEFRLILNAHLDVVPADPPQFRPRRVGDRLYARGAHDMKVTGLVQAAVFRALAGELPYPIALQLVTDEEVGGRDGTLHQLEQGVTGQFVVIGEQSRLEIVNESKGLLRAYLRATGRTGHSAYPWLGDNALLKLTAALDALLAGYPVPEREAWRTTVNVARIHTPNRVFNQVPAEAEAWLDIRYPAEDADLNGRTADEIARHLNGICGPELTVTVDRIDPPHHVDPDSEDVRRLRRAVRDQGYPAGLLRKHGSADGRFYYQRGIDAVIFGIGGAGQHGPEEYADITTIAPYHRALSDFLLSLDGSTATAGRA